MSSSSFLRRLLPTQDPESVRCCGVARIDVITIYLFVALKILADSRRVHRVGVLDLRSLQRDDGICLHRGCKSKC